MDGGALEASLTSLTGRVVESLARNDDVDAMALMFLIRRYIATKRDDLANALGLALTRALDRDARAESLEARARWLTLFAEAATVSEDERIGVAAADLVSWLRQCWGRVEEVEQLMLSIDACLKASEVFDPRELVPKAIDELERTIGRTYQPGAGVAHKVSEPGCERGRLGDQVRAASALLTAYMGTGRLPYAMLAEELVQYARRTLWDEQGGFFDGPARASKPFVLNCEAARVLCRLATLHDAKEYCELAVIAPGSNYRDDATRTLETLGSSHREHGVNAAMYGIALGEWIEIA